MTAKKSLVLLHGWGMNPCVWNPILPRLHSKFDIHNLGLPASSDLNSQDYRLEALASHALDRAPMDAIWLGWSLGAMLALQAALLMQNRVRQLILVAATPKFMNGHDWRYGVRHTVMREFCTTLCEDYDRAVTRFLLLQTGGLSRSLARKLGAEIRQCGAPDVDTLNLGLDLLRETDLRAELGRLNTPCHLIHGELDRIVPNAAAEYLANHISAVDLQTMRTGHAPFLSHPDEFFRAVCAAANIES